MHEWLSWWSTTLPRSGPRVRVPSRARITHEKVSGTDTFFRVLFEHRRCSNSSRSQHPCGCFGRFGWKKVHRTFFLITLTVSCSQHSLFNLFLSKHLIPTESRFLEKIFTKKNFNENKKGFISEELCYNEITKVLPIDG